jgi:hypothetical protein
MSDALVAAIREMQEAVHRLDSLVLKARTGDEAPSLEDLTQLIAVVHRTRDELKQTFDTACQMLDPLMGNDAEVRSPEGILIEKKWSKPRKSWRHQELAEVVAHRIRDLAVDPDTGEVLMSQEEQIATLIKYAAPSYWRVKELKAIGVDADGFCEVGESTPSIIVRPNA